MTCNAQRPSRAPTPTLWSLVQIQMLYLTERSHLNPLVRAFVFSWRYLPLAITKLRLRIDVLNSVSATEYNESAAVASPPRPHIDAAAAAAADSTTTPVECEDPRNRNNGSCTPATRSWRDWRLVHKLVLWLKGEKELAVVNEAELFAEEDASEYFIRRIRISKVVKDEATGERHEQSASALALFDTGCPGDLLSVEFAKGAWPDLDLDEKPNEVIADQIGSRNNGTVVSVGRIDVAWSSRDNRRGKLSCRARTYRDSFHLVDTADFDVVIGSQSMLRYGLLNLNPRIFGHLKARRVARHEGTSRMIQPIQA
jgi:hypothetical protein